MKPVESFILGICGAFIALIIQVTLIPENAFHTITTSTRDSLTLVTLLWVVIAVAAEEITRLGIIARYALMRSVPHNWWIHGALFGCGFGIAEITLSINSLTQANAPFAVTALLLHILLSIFVTRALPHFPFLRYILTFFFLVLLHTLYNLTILFIIPLVHTLPT